MKRWFLRFLLIFGVFLLPCHQLFAAVEVKGGDSLTTSGFSGVINVASAQTIKNGLALSLITSTDFKYTALMPRFGFGFLDCLEIVGGMDIPFNKDAYTAGTLGIKWKFWNNENILLGISGNLQFNGKNNDTNIDAQFLFHASWNLNENFQTTAVFGKTVGQTSNTFTDWDFGMGLEWWIVAQKIFQLALAIDFTNYDYRAYMPNIPAAGAYRRGNVSAAARFGFLNKTIMFDVGATNLLDKDIAFFTSIGTSLNF